MTAPVRLALPPALRRDALIDHAAEHGWRLVHRAPRHLHQWLVLTWELGDGAVRYNEDPELAVRFVERTPHVGLPAEWELVDQAQALALFRGAADPVARLEALAMASALRIGPPGETLVDAWAEALASGAPELARLVLLALGRVPTEDLTGVATRLRQHASDVDRAHLDWIVERRGALERGELNDDVGGIASRDALDQMIVEARDAGRWPRVVAIANRLLELEYNETDALAWGLRAKARAELGETWPAYLDALVASELETDDEAKRGLAELAMSLEPRLEGPLPADRLEALTPISSLRRAELARVFDRMIAHADLGALDPEVRYRAAILALDEGADDAAARLEELVERLPGCREVTALFLRSTPSGEKARRAELRRQLIASFDASPHPFDARAAELLRATTIFSPVKLASLLHDELAEQQREGASPEVLIELSRRGLDADPHSPQAALDHAMMHTAAKRHADAVEAYSRCIALIGRGDSLFLLGDSEGLPWFNRACERAMCGDTEGALTDLAIAIRKNDRWREDSKGEEYFDVLRDDPRFARLLDGDLSAAPAAEGEEPWREATLRCRGLAFRGDLDSALDAGEDAVELGRAAGPIPLAICLTDLGYARLWSGLPEAAVESLEEAVAIFAREPAQDDVELHAGALHQLGAAELALDRFDAAEARMQEARALREARYGAESRIAAKSWGDLARVAAARGELDEAIVRATRSRTILDDVLPTLEGEDRDESIFDHATSSANLSSMHLRAGRAEEIVHEAGAAVEMLERFAGSFALSLAQNLAANLEVAAERDPSLGAAADALIARLEQRVARPAGPRASTAEQRERAVWDRIEDALFTLRDELGMSEPAIGELLRSAMRGEPLPPRIARDHFLAEQIGAFCARTTQPGGTTLVMAAMSVDLLISGAVGLEQLVDDMAAFTAPA